jgi:hypothetical protein
MSAPNMSTSRSIARDAHFGELRGRPQRISMSRRRAMTGAIGSRAWKPRTMLMKSGPSKPTALLR